MDSLDLDDKRFLVEPSDKFLTIEKQCGLLNLNRSSFYYVPKEISPFDLELMDKIDHIYTDHPYYGKRRMMHELRRQGYDVGVKKVRSLMILMGLEAVYPKPNLSQNDQPHKRFPYLLKGLNIYKPNHVWSTDITYIKINGGFIYLTVILDWFSRYIVNWRLSNTLQSDFCIECLEESLQITRPEIMNQDQGVQFTSTDYINVLESNDVTISMDGKGRCFDNIFVERVWRTIKYEEVYLNDYQNVNQAKESIGRYINCYNNVRLHSSLDYQTPNEVYTGIKKQQWPIIII